LPLRCARCGQTGHKIVVTGRPHATPARGGERAAS
jgi:hypothetical protein